MLNTDYALYFRVLATDYRRVNEFLETFRYEIIYKTLQEYINNFNITSVRS